MAAVLIVDVDTGIDDAQALMLAMKGGGSAKVLAITCVKGNSSLDNVCLNTLRTLRECERLDVPVFRGCDKPLLGLPGLKSTFHGNDGLGDVPEPHPPSMDLIQKEHAVHAIIRLVKEHPGEITLVALGPLTNVAMAIRLYPDLGRDLKQVCIMGGNLHGRGNITPCAEFNFYSDPEAAYVVLHELNCSINLLPMETGKELGLSWSFIDEVRNCTSSFANFYSAITKNSNALTKARGIDHAMAYDALLMATILDTAIPTETFEVYCSVERGSGLTRGQMIVDWDEKMKKSKNVKVIRKLDMDKLHDMYRKVLFG